MRFLGFSSFGVLRLRVPEVEALGLAKIKVEHSKCKVQAGEWCGQYWLLGV